MRRGCFGNNHRFLSSDTSPKTFEVNAGNPKNGKTIVGTYTVAKQPDGKFIVTYDISTVLAPNGYIYNIDVVDEHLGISDTMNFTASPGTDDNQDYGVPFADADGKFYIFAHFGVEYR